MNKSGDKTRNKRQNIQRVMNDGRRQEYHASKQTQYSLCFPTFKGIMPHKYLPVGQTVNHYSCKDFLEGLRGIEPSQKREAMVPRMGSLGLISKAIFHPQKSPVLFVKSRLL
jgi:hypothetical protein